MPAFIVLVRIKLEIKTLSFFFLPNLFIQYFSKYFCCLFDKSHNLFDKNMRLCYNFDTFRLGELEMKNSFVIEYLNENEFRKKERSVRKYNMLAYKKLTFEYYVEIRNGNFLGELVAVNKKAGTKDYELKLPTDELFAKVHGDVVLHYTVYENQKLINSATKKIKIPDLVRNVILYNNTLGIDFFKDKIIQFDLENNLFRIK